MCEAEQNAPARVELPRARDREISSWSATGPWSLHSAGLEPRHAPTGEMNLARVGGPIRCRIDTRLGGVSDGTRNPRRPGPLPDLPGGGLKGGPRGGRLSRAGVVGRISPRFRAWAGALGQVAHSGTLRRAQIPFGAMWAGESAFMVALGVLAFRDGGVAAVGAVTAARMAPAALLAPFLATDGRPGSS